MEDYRLVEEINQVAAAAKATLQVGSTVLGSLKCHRTTAENERSPRLEDGELVVEQDCWIPYISTFLPPPLDICQSVLCLPSA